MPLPDDLCKNLKAVLLSQVGGVLLTKVKSDYQKLVGSSLYPEQYGFNSLRQLLESATDIFKIVKDTKTGQEKVYAIDAQSSLLYVNPTARKAQYKPKQFEIPVMPCPKSEIFTVFVGNLPPRMPKVELRKRLADIFCAYQIHEIRLGTSLKTNAVFAFLETTEADGEAILRMKRVYIDNHSLILDRSETTRKTFGSSTSGRNLISNHSQPRLNGSGDFTHQMSGNSGRISSCSSHSSDQVVSQPSGHGGDSCSRETLHGTVQFEFDDVEANDSASVNHFGATGFKGSSMPENLATMKGPAAEVLLTNIPEGVTQEEIMNALAGKLKVSFVKIDNDSVKGRHATVICPTAQDIVELLRIKIIIRDTPVTAQVQQTCSITINKTGDRQIQLPAKAQNAALEQPADLTSYSASSHQGTCSEKLLDLRRPLAAVEGTSWHRNEPVGNASHPQRREKELFNDPAIKSVSASNVDQFPGSKPVMSLMEQNVSPVNSPPRPDPRHHGPTSSPSGKNRGQLPPFGRGRPMLGINQLSESVTADLAKVFSNDLGNQTQSRVGGNVADLSPASNQQHKTQEICMYFKTTGSCRYGEKCFYLHIADEGNSQRAVCRYFHKYGCNLGDRCRFLHLAKESHGSENILQDTSKYSINSVSSSVQDPLHNQNRSHGETVQRLNLACSSKVEPPIGNMKQSLQLSGSDLHQKLGEPVGLDSSTDLDCSDMPPLIKCDDLSSEFQTLSTKPETIESNKSSLQHQKVGFNPNVKTQIDVASSIQPDYSDMPALIKGEAQCSSYVHLKNDAAFSTRSSPKSSSLPSTQLQCKVQLSSKQSSAQEVDKHQRRREDDGSQLVLTSVDTAFKIQPDYSDMPQLECSPPAEVFERQQPSVNDTSAKAVATCSSSQINASDTNLPERIPNDMKSQRLKAMLIDTCIHGSLVSPDDIGDQVDILILYIDPTDNQFFWALINEEPYKTQSSELLLSLAQLPPSVTRTPVLPELHSLRRASTVYMNERVRVWVERVDGDVASVMFIDYGNTDKVPVKSLEMLPEKYWDTPPLAVPCRLVRRNQSIEGGLNQVTDLTEEHCCKPYVAQLTRPQPAGCEFVISIDSLTTDLSNTT